MSPVRVRYLGAARAVTLLERPNRYLALVRDLRSGESLEAHVPNPGRMEELLVPGVTHGWVVPVPASDRRTSVDLVAVRAGRTIVSIDSRVANRLVGRALAQGVCRPGGRRRWVSERTWQGCRFDFAVQVGSNPQALLEVKSSNLRVGRTALFPDAPTRRGAHHLDTLALAARQGIESTVLFAVQRGDVDAFALNRVLDPRFGRSFDRALRSGVQLRAREMVVRPGEVGWGRELPVLTTFEKRIRRRDEPA